MEHNEPNETNEPTQQKQPTKGYGKKSKLQWIALYLVGAVVVYGIIYYVFLHKSGGSVGY